jgi:hypothetical protein
MNSPVRLNTGQPGRRDFLLRDRRALRQFGQERNARRQQVGQKILLLVAQADAPDFLGHNRRGVGAAHKRRHRFQPRAHFFAGAHEMPAGQGIDAEVLGGLARRIARLEDLEILQLVGSEAQVCGDRRQDDRALVVDHGAVGNRVASVDFGFDVELDRDDALHAFGPKLRQLGGAQRQRTRPQDKEESRHHGFNT